MSDRVSGLLGLDQRIDDLGTVMDDAKMDQAALLGISEGGPLAALFAATYPDRCRALVLFGSFARGGSTWEGAPLGSQVYRTLVGQRRRDAPVCALTPRRPGYAKLVGPVGAARREPRRCRRPRAHEQPDRHHGYSPDYPRAYARYRTGDSAVKVEFGRFLAERITGARFLELPGADHFPPFGENAMEIADAIGEFLTGAKAPIVSDTLLATVLFTDMVGSTEKAAALGDRRWRDLLDSHHALVRRNIARFRGREIMTTGDGFFAAFDGPARAVRCACAIVDEIRPLGIEVRAGLHTGECEVMGDEFGGIAVHIGARVASLAGPSEVLVSRTVKDLVAGSGLRFRDRGSPALKGVPGEWRLFAVER